ncbi:MAG TPA: hypothetical protein VL172_11230 [Kofleriaceae bacterium]|nr:hypothetical protein [Kofleriaceae bacterium]
MKAALLLGALAACTGDIGTLHVQVATAPDSTLADDVQHLRATLTDPPTVVDADKQDGGFALDLEVDAEGITGYVELEGFDAGDQRIAFGRSGPLPIAAIDATITIYLGAPMSVQEAPVRLEPVRSAMGVTPLSYGVLYAGGTDGAGDPSNELAIYNVYDHDLQQGDDMPAQRSAPVAMAGSQGKVFVFGGADADGQPTADLFYFDTNVAPAGAWYQLDSDDALARAGADVAPVGGDFFLVTGDPVAAIDGVTGRAAAIDLAPGPLVGTATSVLISDVVNTLIAGDGAGVTGATLYALGTFVSLDQAPSEIARTGHGAAALANGDIAIVGGRTLAGLPASAVRYQIRTRGFTVVDDVLATPRIDAAVASTADYLIVAGGRDQSDQVLGDAEVLDASTLQPVTILPLLVPRTGASAEALPNGQILIAGGVDAAGAPITTLELFTPDR